MSDHREADNKCPNCGAPLMDNGSCPMTFTSWPSENRNRFIRGCEYAAGLLKRMEAMQADVAQVNSDYIALQESFNNLRARYGELERERDEWQRDYDEQTADLKAMTQNRDVAQDAWQKALRERDEALADCKHFVQENERIFRERDEYKAAFDAQQPAVMLYDRYEAALRKIAEMWRMDDGRGVAVPTDAALIAREALEAGDE